MSHIGRNCPINNIHFVAGLQSIWGFYFGLKLDKLLTEDTGNSYVYLAYGYCPLDTGGRY